MTDSSTAPSPTRARPSFWVYVPPPPLFVVTFLLGTQLGRLLTLQLPESLARARQLLGAASLGAAALLLLPAPLLFLLNKTTIVPHGSARALVTRGPYRVTRNPMYLALVMAFVGVALLTNLLWPLLLLPVPIAILSVKVIPFEEARLLEIFGDEYRAYARRVRRWL